MKAHLSPYCAQSERKSDPTPETAAFFFYNIVKTATHSYIFIKDNRRNATKDFFPKLLFQHSICLLMTKHCFANWQFMLLDTRWKRIWDSICWEWIDNECNLVDSSLTTNSIQDKTAFRKVSCKKLFSFCEQFHLKQLVWCDFLYSRLHIATKYQL